MKTILLISPYWRDSHRWMVSTVKLAELWQRLGYRVVVVTMGNWWKREVKSPTLTIYHKKDIFLKDPWNYGIALGFTGLVRRVIRDEKPDIIVVNKVLFWSSLCVVALRLTGTKVILLTDALVGMTWWPRSFVPKVCAAIYAWTAGWLILLCAKHVVFFHPQPSGLLRRLCIAGKSRVIPTGIDPAPYGKQPTNTVTVTYVGRLESVKGVDDFLAAAKAVKQTHPQVRFQVVGWHEDTNPLVRAYEFDIDFLGLRNDIPEILATTDIFVLPSYSEGLSNALMEAMSSKCACIASQVGGNMFLIQNGVSGLLFPAGDRAALMAHMTRLIEDPAKRRAMGEAARERIDKEFSWDVVGKQYQQLFQ
jgi:glycosyltransferase involved in cell wall biosynthesis